MQKLFKSLMLRNNEHSKLKDCEYKTFVHASLVQETDLKLAKKMKTLIKKLYWNLIINIQIKQNLSKQSFLLLSLNTALY